MRMCVSVGGFYSLLFCVVLCVLFSNASGIDNFISLLPHYEKIKVG
jgi:hypothetical protein